MKYRLIIDKNAEEEVRIIAHAPNCLTEQIETLVCNFKGADYIMGYSEDEMRKLTFKEIECITIIGRRVIAIVSDGKRYRIKDNLRDLEEVLPDYFIRINKSSLANEHRIEKFQTAVSGGVDALFICGYKEYVSRRCFKEIRRRYE